MYAVIEVGAKQYLVRKDDVIEVEKLPSPSGKEVILDKVLLLSKDKKVEFGTPYLKDAQVKCELLGEIKGKKAISFKYRRRKSEHWTKGHRQQLMQLKIKSL